MFIAKLLAAAAQVALEVARDLIVDAMTKSPPK